MELEQQPINVSARKTVVAQAPIIERKAFLKKVYGLLSLSVLMATIGAWATLSNEALLTTVINNIFIFFILEIGTMIWCMFARQKETQGLIALFSFTTLTGIVAAPVVMMYTQASVVNALLLTALVFGGLTLYVANSKRDFSFLGGMLTVGLIVLIVGTLLNAFFFKSPANTMFMNIGGAFLFSGFIVYDTFMIMRKYPTNEYILATISLYIDVLNLFLILLQLFGGRRD